MRQLAILIALALLLGARVATAARALEMGSLVVPPPRGYVNDFAGVLTPGEERRLESLCSTIWKEGHIAVAIAVLPGLEGEPPAEVRNRLYEAWGVGEKGDDRGLLILHAIRERRIEVEVGYGLEPDLPDARVGRILDRAVVPLLKAGKYAQAYESGILNLVASAVGEKELQRMLARGRVNVHLRQPRSVGRCGSGLGIFFLALFLLFAARHPWLALLLLLGGPRGGGGFRGGFGGGFGGFGGAGGFGGGLSGGGGAGRSY